LIVALDVPEAAAAHTLVRRLAPEAGWVKVGLQLFTAAGPDLVRALRSEGLRVFLDLKLHDIPATVERATAAAASLGVEMISVHASGGAAMLRAARRAAGAPGSGGPMLFAVTVLTSLDDADAAAIWGGTAGVAPRVERLALLAREHGADGVVASAREAERVRGVCGAEFGILTPGIRRAGDAAGDQARVASPEEALRAGADYLVVGRAVTEAPDPAAAFRAIRQELRAATAAAGVAP
jgi:orotidine-5'-phosphate decarboxylase